MKKEAKLVANPSRNGTEALSGHGADRPPVAILGVAFDSLTLEDTIARIERMIALRRPHYLVTANVDFIVQARGDVELHRILCDAHLVMCDGTPIVWASRLLGNPLPERVAGADVVPKLIAVAAKKGYRLFFLGATAESSEAAVARLQAQYPELVIAGHYSPPFKKLLEMDHREIRRRIRAAKPDLLFVSFGCPKQEKFLAMHYRDLKVPVSIGVGATIDFLAGQVRRAPLWMQHSGTEWLFRLVQEPRRLFRRYLKDLAVFSSCLASQRRLTSPSNLNHNLYRNRNLNLPPDLQLIHLPDRLDVANAAEATRVIGDALVDGRDCLVDASNIGSIDSTGVALLLQFRRNLAALGLTLVLVSPSPRLQRVLAWMHLENLFVLAPDFAEAQAHLEQSRPKPSMPSWNALQTSPGPLAWHGEITAANAHDVWEQTKARLAALPVLSLCVLDLSAVRFIDSSGLGVMIRAKKFAQAHQKELHFANPCPAVLNVLHLAHLEAYLLAPVEKQAAALANAY